jgi:beta-lactamase regulating signal transducer with metallopeptidase domain
VLLHELAHVKRWDWLTQLAARLACALYWWHPLAWVAARRLREERELACDDLVLAHGTVASTYAADLLEIARVFRVSPASALAGVAMARRSQLAGRLLAVLDAARSRRSQVRPFRHCRGGRRASPTAVRRGSDPLEADAGGREAPPR